jgi:hypothetical protein
MFKLENILIEVSNNSAITIAKKVWTDIKEEIHSRFNDGYATCTYAVKELAHELYKNNVPFVVISGTYLDSGHWWISLEDGTIIDLGNNIDEKNIETGIIQPIISKNTSGYKVQDRVTYREFLKAWPQIKNF